MSHLLVHIFGVFFPAWPLIACMTLCQCYIIHRVSGALTVSEGSERKICCYAVIITSRKSNRNSLVLLQMLKMLPSWLNALSTTAKDLICSLEFFSRNCWNLISDVVSEFFQSVFLQQNHAASKPEIWLLFMTTTATILWSFMQHFQNVCCLSKSFRRFSWCIFKSRMNSVQFFFCQHSLFPVRAFCIATMLLFSAYSPNLLLWLS